MIGLYIHWPFCISKCPYCDFNSHVREKVDHKRWERALLTELRHYATQTQDQQLRSIFFGGGTPSLMDPQTVAVLIEEAKSLWPHEDPLEITLEANPGSVDMERFQAFSQAGINRLSMGIQSLRDDQLKFLGRKHSALEALDAIDIAQKTFSRYSFDLIYARPDQTVEDWHQELEEALTYAGDHLSLYQLTIEPGTAFYTQYQRGDLIIPDEDLASDLYEATEETMKKAGRPSYEVSNYAKPGQECQHNMVYWRYQDYVGIGPGAHGRLTLPHGKMATRGLRAPELWLEKVENEGHGAAEITSISSEQQIQESLLMGLRLNEGVSTQGKLLNNTRIDTLERAGFLVSEGQILKTTPKGRLCLNKVLEEILAPS